MSYCQESKTFLATGLYIDTFSSRPLILNRKIFNLRNIPLHLKYELFKALLANKTIQDKQTSAYEAMEPYFIIPFKSFSLLHHSRPVKNNPYFGQRKCYVYMWYIAMLQFIVTCHLLTIMDYRMLILPFGQNIISTAHYLFKLITEIKC